MSVQRYVPVGRVQASMLFPIALTLHNLGYAPRVVTAMVVNLPVMPWLLILGVRGGWVSGRKAVVFAVGVPVAFVALILVLFVARGNFAGTYPLIRWECGPSCVMIAILDVRTIAVHDPPLSSDGPNTECKWTRQAR